MIGQAFLDRLSVHLDAALAQAAVLVRDKARALAPDKSGTLRQSIVADGHTVIAMAPYAAIVERKQPFLQPALQESRAEIVQIILNQGAVHD